MGGEDGAVATSTALVHATPPRLHHPARAVPAQALTPLRGAGRRGSTRGLAGAGGGGHRRPGCLDPCCREGADAGGVLAVAVAVARTGPDVGADHITMMPRHKRLSPGRWVGLLVPTEDYGLGLSRDFGILCSPVWSRFFLWFLRLGVVFVSLYCSARPPSVGVCHGYL